MRITGEKVIFQKDLLFIQLNKLVEREKSYEKGIISQKEKAIFQRKILLFEKQFLKENITFG